MNNRNNIAILQQESILATNKVLRNTYLLLGANFIVSAFCAFLSASAHTRPLHPVLMIVGMYGLMFLTNALRNSALGLVAVFAFTGFLGYTLGPILDFYVANFSNGP